VEKRLIGEGAYSRVFQVTESNRSFAIKKIDKKKQKRHRIDVELEASMILKHPCIPKLFWFFEDHKNFSLIFEYIDGLNLLDLLEWKNQPLSEQMIKFIFKQLAKTVHYVHSKRIYHRDLKLENVMINNQGKIKLIDFGLATIEKTKKSPVLRDFVGSLDFVCPEILRKTGYNPDKADIFSLGVILFALFYSTLPFEDKKRQSFSRGDILHPSLTFPPTKLPSIPAIELMSKMLAIDPKERFTLQEILKSKWMKRSWNDKSFDLAALLLG